MHFSPSCFLLDYDLLCCWTYVYSFLQVSSAVVGLLLQNGANPDILCEGHSALSLAILSGNDMVGHHCTVSLHRILQKVKGLLCQHMTWLNACLLFK